MNDAPLDYGPTVILEHETDEGERFWTLYGHLSEDSLSGLECSKPVGRGEGLRRRRKLPEKRQLGRRIFTFQIILDLLDREGDFPGVAKPSERTLWLALSPNPRDVLGLPESAPEDPRTTNEAIRSRASRKPIRDAQPVPIASRFASFAATAPFSTTARRVLIWTWSTMSAMWAIAIRASSAPPKSKLPS